MKKSRKQQMHQQRSPETQGQQSAIPTGPKGPAAMCAQGLSEMFPSEEEMMWKAIMRNCIVRLFCVAMSFARELGADQDDLIDELNKVYGQWVAMKEGKDLDGYYYAVWRKASSLEDFSLFLETSCRP